MSWLDLIPGAGGVDVIRAPGPGLDAVVAVVEDLHLVTAATFHLVIEIDGVLDVTQGLFERGELFDVNGRPAVGGDLVELFNEEHDQTPK